MSANEAASLHTSVLLEETLELLGVKPGGLYVDATLGLGGHSEAILGLPETKLIGIDQDAEAIEFAEKRLAKFGERIRIVQANFSDIKTTLSGMNVEKVDGIIADLGVSSLQLDSEERGFSFRSDAPLDMRMDREGGETAADLLAELSEEDIANLIYRFGEERFSRRIARRIVERRKAGQPVTTTRELSELVERSVRRSPKDKIHPATRTFQALRIAVNHELDILEDFINDAVEALNIGGRLVVISFHSLEDRIVKQTFQKLSGRCLCPPRIPQCVCGAVKKIEVLTRKPIVAGEIETDKNPRARSAKLRAAERSN
ncbi:MAG TPA: 16S rRNA (cytosine(1402)-N(4))-methyltransferase RsmH [Pyrinomonadaceae bacterium]|nr:16S rRNA (cytosine(1402)-N(4))-methyltransferase RsmH [Pyrinomonadaceae bacterium]